ncbi:glycoside hydrolase family 13 protein [Azoarcus indigens]|uniref:Alpha-amylase n=1 Tax=Azoarcus indigens TaxID=29545 RepID=A0A4R6DGJ3_9RHOO|nr:alpha-glucosidase [Azoarcus indigens]TDN43771.1 alpha-glucosidase [Azoarcus indigens]
MTAPWWKDAVIYQIYPRSFMDSNGDGIGDLPGILARLDYLQWLGVNALWLCPIFTSPNDDNGYDISDYQGIMAEFGTMEDFDRLLDEVHRRGMRLILDLVLNHTSDEHPWFKASRSSRDDPKRDWYIWRDGRGGPGSSPRRGLNGGPDGGPPNNWESIFKGPAWQYDAATGQYFLHLFSPRQPDLNWENPAVRKAMAATARWWLDKGVDGFRIDAITHLKKTPGLPDAPNPDGLPFAWAYPHHRNVPGVLDFVEELAADAFRDYDAATIGEANGVAADQAEAWVSGQRLSMILQFEHSHLWSSQPHAGLDLPALRRILGRWQHALHGRGWNALFIENHDLPRVLSRWGDPQRHRRASATALATMYFLMEGTPFIYQGQELGMANTRFDTLDDFVDVYARNRIRRMREAGQDDDAILRELAVTSRDNARTPMPWDASANAGFSSGTPWLRPNPDYREINVAGERADPASVLNYYRRLIALRAAEPALRHGRYGALLERNPQIYAYTRRQGGSGFLVLCNLSGQPAPYQHRGLRLRHEALVLANREVAPHPPGIACLLAPYEARVYRVDFGAE